MLIFIPMLIFITCLPSLSKKKDKLTEYCFYSLFLITLFLIVVFRSTDGDMLNYERIYNNIKGGGNGFGVEPLYYFINKIFPIHNYRIYLFFLTFILVLGKFSIYNALAGKSIVLLFMYSAIQLFLIDFILLRQSLSIFFIMVATNALLKENKKLFLLFQCLAMLSHFGAIIYFIAYFIYKKNLKRTTVIILVILSYLISLVVSGNLIYSTFKLLKISGILLTKASIYLEYSDKTFLSSRQILILFYFLINYRFIRKDSKILKLFNIYIIGILIRILMSNFGDIGFRMLYYFLWIEPIISSYLMSKDKYKDVIIDKFIDLMILFSYLLSLIQFIMSKSYLYNYSSLLNLFE